MVEEPGVEESSGVRPFAHLFRRSDGRQIVVAWVKAAPQTVDIVASRAATRAIEYQFDGSEVPYSRFSGRTLGQVELRPGTARVFELLP